MAHAIIARRGPISRAKAAVTRAVELSPTEGSLYRLLSTAHSFDGSINDAITAATRAVELQRHIGGMTLVGSLEQLGDLLAQSRQTREALAAYREARPQVDHPVVAARLDRKIAGTEAQE